MFKHFLQGEREIGSAKRMVWQPPTQLEVFLSGSYIEQKKNPVNIWGMQMQYWETQVTN